MTVFFRTSLFVLCLILGLSLQFSAIAGQPVAAEKPFDLNSALKDGFSPVFRISSSSEYVIRNPEVTDSPVRALRFVYSGHPFQQVQTKGKGDSSKDKKEYRIEYADVLLVPVKSSFRLKHALVFAQPERRKETADYFYSQFGIEWRNLSNGLQHFTVYAGKTEKYYVFASANILFLLDLKKKLRLQDGFNPVDLLTDCLSIHDFNNISANAAVGLLPRYGNVALPLIQDSIQKMEEMNEGAFPQFRVLVAIDTAEAVAIMNEYAETSVSRKEILMPLFDAVISARKIDERYLPCYTAMLRERVGIPFAAVAMTELKQTGALGKILRGIRENPEDYDTYKEVVKFMYAYEYPDRKLIHESAEKQIRMLLIRNGEVPDTMKVYDIFNTKNSSERETALDKKDMTRVTPILADLLDTPDRDMTMLVGLNLAFTEFSDPRVSNKYTNRVRAFGISLLKNMPDKRGELEKLLRSLYSNAKSKKKRALIYETAHQLDIKL